MEICFVQQWQPPGVGMFSGGVPDLQVDESQYKGGGQRVGINGLRRREVMLSGCRKNTHFYAGEDSRKKLVKMEL